MKKRTIIILLILTLSMYLSNINVQITAEENNYRPTSLGLTPHEPINITSDSNFIDYGFPGSGTVEDPYIIEGYSITTSNDYGINISGTTKYFIVRNCYIDAEWYGICINSVADGTATIINNTCNNNNWNGISLSSSGSSTIANNMCSNNHYDGISLEESGSSTIANNTCNNNSYDGIGLEESGSSTIANNTCSNNWVGISLYSSDSSTIANNTCNNNNNLHGIYLYYSAFCVVTYNLLQENEDYGIYLFFGSNNNLIHHNNFVDNNLEGTSQAFDSSTNNIWYDTETLEGNYWSDWSEIDSYSIDGSASSVDLYPLDEPAEYSTDENQLNFTFTLLMLVIPLLLTRIISKKVKKE